MTPERYHKHSSILELATLAWTGVLAFSISFNMPERWELYVWLCTLSAWVLIARLRRLAQ